MPELLAEPVRECQKQTFPTVRLSILRLLNVDQDGSKAFFGRY